MTALVAALALMSGPWHQVIASTPHGSIDLGPWDPTPGIRAIPNLGIPIGVPVSVPVYRPPPVYYAMPIGGACVRCRRGR